MMFSHLWPSFFFALLIDIFQCMSLCRDCFQSGNHVAEGHDYNMFKSQAGGACDCGDSSVMRSSGFCSKVRVNFAMNSCLNSYLTFDEVF